MRLLSASVCFSQQLLGLRASYLLVPLFLGSLLVHPSSAQDQAAATISRPLAHQVVQREGYVPAKAHVHQPGGPQLGFAKVPVQASFPPESGEQFDFRVVALPGSYGLTTDWAALEADRTQAPALTATPKIAAGGWYRLELRQRVGQEVRRTAQMEPIGVGEVFVIAGQSYAAGANDELQKVLDPIEGVAAFDTVTKRWQVAHDPQPNVGDGGTIWPPLGDILVPLLRVPVGLVNVAVGGTSSRQWLPKTELHERLAVAGSEIGQFRAVLWQQGESDVIEKVSTEIYVKNLTQIRQTLVERWKFAPPWLLAKSTLHPEVYNNPAGEEQIRLAIEQLWQQPGFRPGPDTDILGGENRGGPGSRRHFSRLGQRRAAQLWFTAIWCEMHEPAASQPTPAAAKQP